MKKTTCHNRNCPDIDTCTYNIHKGGEKPCPEGQDYQSMKQHIWASHLDKCEELGIEPMPYDVYFDD